MGSLGQEETKRAVLEVKETLQTQLQATKQMVADAALTAQNAARLEMSSAYGKESFSFLTFSNNHVREHPLIDAHITPFAF
jgi:hypothetical protein